MYIRVFLAYFFLLFFSTNTPLSAKDLSQYQPILTKKSSIPLKIESRVEKTPDALKNRASEMIAMLKELDKEISGLNLDEHVYLYTYTFKNESPYPLRIYLGGFNFMTTAFKDVVQDFVLPIDGYEKKTIRFLATGKPELNTAEVVIGIWKKLPSNVLRDFYGDAPRWIFIGDGHASFWTAPWNGVHLALP